MGKIKIKLLGYFKVELDGIEITKAFRTEKEKALFAYLVMESDRPATRDVLAELLWPGRSTSKARTNLRQAIYGIRKAIHDQGSDTPYLSLLDDMVQFKPDNNHWLDTATFTDNLQDTQNHLHDDLATCESCLTQLKNTIELYRGSFFEDLYQVDSISYMEWLYSYRERYFRYMLSALQRVSRVFETQGDFDKAIQYTQQQVVLDPLDENSQRQLMHLLFKSGHRSAALEQYHTCHKILSEELGVEPGPETRSLYNRIREGTIPLQRQPAKSLPEIPTYLTSYIGRKVEYERLSRCLENPACRLLTFVGIPGIGKTRLAIQIANQFRGFFSDDVWFFQGESKSPSLLKKLLKGLKIEYKKEQSAKELLIDALVPKNALLVLDNFDLNKNEIELLIEILHSAPEVKIIVTSRKRLNYQAACLFEIRGLRYPRRFHPKKSLNYPAVELFEARAVQCHSSFKISEKNLQHIVRICQLVEGNPLAIELAACNVSHFSCQQIADSLEYSICILATQKEDIPLRHRKMRYAIEDFWDDLPDVDKINAIQLSTYEDQFKLEDAQVISSLPPEALSSLIDNSVLYKNSQGYLQMPNLLRTHIIENGLEAVDLENMIGESEIDHRDQILLESNLQGIASSEIFWDRLKHLIIRSQRNNTRFGVVVLDLFSSQYSPGVNMEDKSTTIALAADYLNVTLRKSDTIARLKPNEFSLLIEDLKSKDDFEIVLEKIRVALSKPLDNGTNMLTLPLQMGSAFFPDDAQDASLLIQHARQEKDKSHFGNQGFHLYN